jgi:hypothetical protein
MVPAALGPSGPHSLARTASWLDRANMVLQSSQPLAPSGESESAGSQSSNDSIRSELQQVQSLIREGPAIQQSTAGIQQFVQHATTQLDPPTEASSASAGGAGLQSHVVCAAVLPAGPPSPPAEPEEKRQRLRTAEDAEALVGFLRSVRASAAASSEKR